MLPRRIPKQAKRATRWRSQAHATFVRKHACSMCGSDQSIEFAHVRLCSHTGMGQRPDDWNAVSLCKPCHQRQHNIGEASFWRGKDVLGLIEEFIAASPRKLEIQLQRSLRQ